MKKTASPARRVLRVLGSIALVLSLLIFTWLMNGGAAYGWLLNADHYGAPFAAFGGWTIALAAGMTAAVILYFCKADLVAAILGAVCYVPMLGILLRAMQIAETNGWSGVTEKSFGVTAAAVWRNACAPNAVTLILLLLLTLTRFLSYDAAVKRQAKREAKRAKENAPAPSILGDKNPR